MTHETIKKESLRSFFGEPGALAYLSFAEALEKGFGLRRHGNLGGLLKTDCAGTYRTNCRVHFAGNQISQVLGYRAPTRIAFSKRVESAA